MSSISGVGYSSYADYGRFASGRKIQTAADGAAQLAIIQKQDSQVRGYQAGARNIGTAQDLLNVSDGAMSGITDYLQRIRELGLQASNSALMTDSDLEGIQQEIDQLKQGISDIAANTNFNRKNLLDGTAGSLHVAANADGGGMDLNMSDATLKALGIADFDVTKEFSLDSIDRALEKVGSGRSSMGAQSNALEYAYNYNTNTVLNTTASKSRLEDLDYAGAISDLKKQETLREYSMFMQMRKQQDEANRMHRLFFA